MIAGGAAHAGQYVNFLPGTYNLASSISEPSGEPPTPLPPDQTLVLTVSAGVATFSLTGAETVSFTLPNDASISTDFGEDSVVFSSSAAGSPTWSPASYPYITFWSTAELGGLTIGTIPGDQGTNLIDNFESNDGTGQFFSPVPEPAAWTVMLVGLAGLGATVRSRRAGASMHPPDRSERC
jgi:hypothetical protein